MNFKIETYHVFNHILYGNYISYGNHILYGNNNITLIFISIH